MKGFMGMNKDSSALFKNIVTLAELCFGTLCITITINEPPWITGHVQSFTLAKHFSSLTKIGSQHLCHKRPHYLTRVHAAGL